MFLYFEQLYFYKQQNKTKSKTKLDKLQSKESDLHVAYDFDFQTAILFSY